MQIKFLSMLLVSVAFLPLSSCDKKAGNDEKAQTAPKAEDPFILVPRIVKNDGAYELLTVIEGVEPNRRFVTNLQIVGGQRANLKKLKDQADKSDEDKQKLETLEKKLQENAAAMLKTYGYNIEADYLFIPVHSSLVKVADGKKELVRSLATPGDYNKLQAMRSKYKELTTKSGEGAAEAQTLATKLMKEYNCDVKGTYEVDIHKGALYRKVN